MQDLISNSLRGSVTSIMNVLLLFTLTKSKYGRRSNFLIVSLVFIIGIASNSWFYMYGNLTGLSRFNIVMFIVLGICLKPLSKTGVMQWSFNFLTTVNIMMMIIILSFHLGNSFPIPVCTYTHPTLPLSPDNLFVSAVPATVLQLRHQQLENLLTIGHLHISQSRLLLLRNS